MRWDWSRKTLRHQPLAELVRSGATTGGICSSILILTGCLHHMVVWFPLFILFLICWVFFIIEYSRNSLDSNILKEVLVESSLKVRFRLCYSEIKWKAISSEHILSLSLSLSFFSNVLKSNKIDDNYCHLFISNKL